MESYHRLSVYKSLEKGIIEGENPVYDIEWLSNDEISQSRTVW